MIMLFESYENMKKRFPAFTDGRQKVVVDLSILEDVRNDEQANIENGLSSAALADEISKGILEKLSRYYSVGNDLFCVYFQDTNYGRKYYVDVEIRAIYVYDAKTGKQKYIALEVVGLRLSSVMWGARLSDFCKTWGKWYLNSVPSKEVAI